MFVILCNLCRIQVRTNRKIASIESSTTERILFEGTEETISFSFVMQKTHWYSFCSGLITAEM